MSFSKLYTVALALLLYILQVTLWSMIKDRLITEDWCGKRVTPNWTNRVVAYYNY
jgi:hypothetical protein